MENMPEDQEKGVLKIFLSSTFRDLQDMRKLLLDRLALALDASAMERFISTGKGPQDAALRELSDSEIVIFLISPYYGTNINYCKFKEECKANCGMKNGKETISYTLCEYRVARAEDKPRLIYIINGKWDVVSRNGAPKVWKVRNEVQEEFCPKIENNEEGVERIVTNLAKKIIEWYSDNRINFEKFCGRRNCLRELFSKMNRSVNVHGVGGIGKTTLCEIALLLCMLLGRKVVYVGFEEAYASGTGYEFASKRLTSRRVSDLTIDDIIDALGFGDELEGLNRESKIDSILQILDENNIVLFIDNFKETEGLKELVKKGNTLSRGCILVSSKKELKVAFYRVPVGSIEKKERGKLTEIMASRMGKKIEEREIEKIKVISEGHPIATYLLISNLGRVPIEKLESFKEGLDFSQDDDVKEYMNRVIKSGISLKAYNLLKDLSVIEEEIDRDSIYEASRYPLREEMGELIDASMIERIGNKIVWKYSQIKETIFEDNPKRHGLAAAYYEGKWKKYGNFEDRIEMLYHMARTNYTDELLEAFVKLEKCIKEGNPAMRLLPKLGEEIKKHVDKEDKAIACDTLGNIYWKFSNYKNKAVNCKKAIVAFKEALEIYSPRDFPVQYAMTQNNLGNAYSTLAEVENKKVNCKKAIKVYEETLEVLGKTELPGIYRIMKNNLRAISKFCKD